MTFEDAPFGEEDGGFWSDGWEWDSSVVGAGDGGDLGDDLRVLSDITTIKTFSQCSETPLMK